MKKKVKPDNRSIGVRYPYANLALAIITQAFRDLHCDLYKWPEKERKFEMSLDAYSFLTGADCQYYLRSAGFSVSKLDILKAMAKANVNNLKRPRG